MNLDWLGRLLVYTGCSGDTDWDIGYQFLLMKCLNQLLPGYSAIDFLKMIRISQYNLWVEPMVKSMVKIYSKCKEVILIITC